MSIQSPIHSPNDADTVVITASDLRDQLARRRRPVVILEVRRHASDDAALTGHLPGARLVTLTTDLVGRPSPGSGDLPLPTREQIQHAVRSWGIEHDSLVVVYSREAPSLAARAWWTLRWAGVPDVRYLDGGHTAWVAAGGELSDDTAPVTASDFTVQVGSLPVLDSQAAGDLARSGVLLDARNPGTYAGRPHGGHVPGAVNVPSSVGVDAEGYLHADDELRTLFGRVGADEAVEVGAYCGSGTGATLDLLALAKLGINGAYYPGSFSAWSSDPSRPVATGDQPG